MAIVTYLDVTERVIEKIAELGEARRPREACGILLPVCHEHQPPCDSVVELGNVLTVDNHIPDPRPAFEGQYLDPTKAYTLDQATIEQTLVDYLERHPEQINRILYEDWLDQEWTKERSAEEIRTLVRDGYMLWHTHPDGFVGPSEGDMQFRIPGIRYLVVSLGPKPIATQY